MSESKNNLNEVLEAFLRDQSKENKIAMVNALLRSVVLLPGIFPPGADMSKLQGLGTKGEKVQLPPNMQPLPAVLKNKEGEAYFPAYTSQEELPKEPKPKVLLNMPFMALVTMALKNPAITGIAVNPYKQNILIKEPLLKALKEDEERKRAALKGNPGATMTPADAKAFFRKKVETELIPKALFEDPKGFTDRLCAEEGEFLRKIYERVYKNPADCPYPAADFSVMALSIREGLLLIRTDLPAVPKGAANAERVYVLYGEESGRAEYYLIEKVPGGAAGKIGRVLSNGTYEEIGEAPDSGAELQRMLDLYDYYAGEGN